jgi:hypothetical protein
MGPEERTDDPTHGVPFNDLVKELDEILDGWFMVDIAAALEAARAVRASARAEAEGKSEAA